MHIDMTSKRFEAVGGFTEESTIESEHAVYVEHERRQPKLLPSRNIDLDHGRVADGWISHQH
jgi:hypothetical protein